MVSRLLRSHPIGRTSGARGCCVRRLVRRLGTTPGPRISAVFSSYTQTTHLVPRMRRRRCFKASGLDSRGRVSVGNVQLGRCVLLGRLSCPVQFEPEPGLHGLRKNTLGRPWVPNDCPMCPLHVDVRQGRALVRITRLNTRPPAAPKQRGAARAPTAAWSRTCGMVASS